MEFLKSILKVSHLQNIAYFKDTYRLSFSGYHLPLFNSSKLSMHDQEKVKKVKNILLIEDLHWLTEPFFNSLTWLYTQSFKNELDVWKKNSFR